MQLGGFNFLQGFVQVEGSIIISCCCGATSDREGLEAEAVGLLS